MSLADNIKKLREDKGLMQKEVAAEINMDILNAIKAAFKEKTIVITIEEEMDETAFLKADPANKVIYNRLNKLILETART